MSAQLEQLTREVLALPVESRAYLVDRLVESLETAVDPAVEQTWLDEAERRWKELAEGKVQGVPAEAAMREAYAALRKCE